MLPSVTLKVTLVGPVNDRPSLTRTSVTLQADVLSIVIVWVPASGASTWASRFDAGSVHLMSPAPSESVHVTERPDISWFPLLVSRNCVSISPIGFGGLTLKLSVL